jgi:peptidoglycan/LPS O-acetylase OafA/YrhL
MDSNTRLVNPSFWTLPIEFRWYFVFPIALVLWSRFPYVFGASLLAIPLLWPTRAASTDLYLLPGFLLGIVAADIAIRGSRFTRFCPIACLCMGVLAAAIEPTPRQVGMLGVGGFNPLWMPVSFLLVVSVGESAVLRRLLSARWITAVGIASYSIYLVHQPFIDVLEHYGEAPIVALAVALTMGFGFWAIVERPLVTTSLRNRAVAAVQQQLTHFARRLHVTETAFVMRRNTEPASELEAIA